MSFLFNYALFTTIYDVCITLSGFKLIKIFTNILLIFRKYKYIYNTYIIIYYIKNVIVFF